MRIFSAIGDALRASATSIAKSYGYGSSMSPVMQYLTGADLTLEGLLEFVREPLVQHPTVQRCIRLIATSGAQVEMEVWKQGANRTRGGDEPVENHWLTQIMRSPGRNISGVELVEAVLVFLESEGEAFLWHKDLRRGEMGSPRHPMELWTLHPRCMMQDVNANGYLTGWWYSGQGKREHIPVDQVSYFHYFNPYDAVRGLSPMRAAFLEYTGDHRAAVHNRAMLDNGNIPAIVFESDKAWTDGERQTFIDGWHEKRRGAVKTGLSATLPYKVKANILKQSRLEMEFLEGRKFSITQICSALGVPPALVGVEERTGLFENSTERMRYFWHLTMFPKLTMVARILNETLLRRYEPGFESFFKTEPINAQIDATEFHKKVESAGKLFSMGFPPADINDRLDLGLPTSGKPWLKEGYLPFSVVPASSVNEPEDEEEEPEEEEPVTPPVEESPWAHRHRKIRETDASRWTGLSKLYGDIGRGYQRRLRSWLWGLRNETLKNIGAKGITVSQFGALVIDPAKQASVVIWVKRALDDLLWDEQDAEDALVEISRPTWQRSMKRGADVLAGETGITLDFNILDPGVLGFLASKESKITNVSDGVRQRVAENLAEGIAQGETVDDLAARVREAFDAERGRSITIARTETAQAFAGGRFQAMKQWGIQTQEWISSKDDRVRDSHEALDGEVAAVGEHFSNGLLYPGDPDGPPEEVINCRCANGAVVTESADEED